MNDLHPAGIEFIEQVSVLAESAGLPRVGGRIVGLLMLTGDPVSMDDLATSLHASRGSVSGNIRLLESRGLVQRVSRLGERRDLFVIDSSFPEALLERSLQEQRAIRSAAMRARRDLPLQWKRARVSLERIEQFTALSIEAAESMLASWRRIAEVRQD